MGAASQSPASTVSPLGARSLTIDGFPPHIAGLSPRCAHSPPSLRLKAPAGHRAQEGRGGGGADALAGATHEPVPSSNRLILTSPSRHVRQSNSVAGQSHVSHGEKASYSAT
jgi:hypothetical protein